MKQNDINITQMIKEQVKKIPNWKSPGLDGFQFYWLRKFVGMEWVDYMFIIWFPVPRHWKALKLCV